MITPIGPKTPAIDPSCFVATTSSVIGDVAVGKGSSIWFGAIARGDVGIIRIGRGTNIQDLCCLHVDAQYDLSIGDGVTVGHRAILHGCVVGNRVLIGMGAIVMNGATVGEECIIGAGALVTEGTTIPPRSLVLGVPGKIIRPLTKEEIASIDAAADVYAKGAASYAEAGLGHVLRKR